MKIKLFKHVETLLLLFSLTLILLTIGATMNFVVISKNSCRMPVFASLDYWSLKSDSTHFLFSNPRSVNYFYFTDIFPLGETIRFSLGDVFLTLGMISLVTFIVFIGILNYKIEKHKKQWGDITI